MSNDDYVKEINKIALGTKQDLYSFDLRVKKDKTHWEIESKDFFKESDPTNYNVTYTQRSDSNVVLSKWTIQMSRGSPTDVISVEARTGNVSENGQCEYKVYTSDELLNLHNKLNPILPWWSRGGSRKRKSKSRKSRKSRKNRKSRKSRRN